MSLRYRLKWERRGENVTYERGYLTGMLFGICFLPLYEDVKAWMFFVFCIVYSAFPFPREALGFSGPRTLLSPEQKLLAVSLSLIFVRVSIHQGGYAGHPILTASSSTTAGESAIDPLDV